MLLRHTEVGAERGQDFTPASPWPAH